MAQAGSAYNLHERHKQNHVKIGNWVEERALIESAPGMCVPVRNGHAALLGSLLALGHSVGRGARLPNSRSCCIYSLISLLLLPQWFFLACFLLSSTAYIPASTFSAEQICARQRRLLCCPRYVVRLRRSTCCLARLCCAGVGRP